MAGPSETVGEAELEHLPDASGTATTPRHDRVIVIVSLMAGD
jgi:hypothetical protein